MRPLYHFTPPQNFMNDPNGLVYFDGEYHLFYQHNPQGDTWGHMSWGHAVSPDGLVWEHLPMALSEEGGIMIFSGSALVDWNNTSGFTHHPQGDPLLVAIYTGHGWGLETQNIAYSLDRGRTWTKYAHNPVLDLASDNFRDPKVFWHAPTQRWVMVVSLALEHQVCLYTSHNLKTWTHLSNFGPAGLTETCWECPDLFELPIQGEDSKAWVLKVDSGPGWYIVGDFDGTNFTATQAPHRIDYGPDFYACQTWNDLPRGQHRLLGWMVNWPYANALPTHPWRGVMTIPREMALRRNEDELRLAQTSISIERLRGQVFNDHGVVSGERSLPIRAERLEILAEFELEMASEFGLRVRVGPGESTTIGVDAATRQVFVDRRISGDSSFSQGFAGRFAAPLALDSGRVTLHILVDSCSVEVFVGDGESVGLTALTSLIFPAEASQGVFLYAKDGPVKLKTLKIWPLDAASGRHSVGVQSSYDAVAARYGEEFLNEQDHKPLDRFALGRLIELVGEPGPICDLGCGPGQIARYLKAYGAPDVLGIDLSPEMIAVARRLAPDIPFHQADMRALPFPDASWGGIAAFYSLIHIPRPQMVACLEELRRVLRPSGALLLTFHIGVHDAHVNEWWGKPVSLDFEFFQREEMETWLQAAGFQVIETIERSPYANVEHQSRRAYIFARNL